jgi:hypothetical protein
LINKLVESIVILQDSIISNISFDIYRTSSGDTYISETHALALGDDSDESLLLKLKVIISLVSQIPKLLVKNALKEEREETLLHFRFFEHELFGGFINFSEITPGSQIVRYILHAEDNWRDPFKETLLRRFPKLVKEQPLVLKLRAKYIP